MLDRRYLSPNQIRNHFDWKLLGLAIVLAGIGLIAIHSSTFEGHYAGNFDKQLIWLGISLVAMFLVLLPDYHILAEYSNLIYLLVLVLLVTVLLVGKTVHGSTSWFHFGIFSIQPSEVAKLTTILALACFFSNTVIPQHLTLQDLGYAGVIAGLPMLLIYLQGDLGTMVTLIPAFAAMSFVCGLKRRIVLPVLLALVLMTPLIWGLVLKDYQKERITSFLAPEKAPFTVGYQSLQSKIAIGSGAIVGKGIRRGSQNQLGFLPDRHTDFIFAVVSEEAGFIGAMTVLLLFLVLLFRIYHAATSARDRLGTLICVGVLALLSFQVCVNVGMVVGILPIAGLPLPLLSYGGSSLLSTFLALGLVLNVELRRYTY